MTSSGASSKQTPSSLPTLKLLEDSLDVSDLHPQKLLHWLYLSSLLKANTGRTFNFQKLSPSLKNLSKLIKLFSKTEDTMPLISFDMVSCRRNTLTIRCSFTTLCTLNSASRLSSSRRSTRTARAGKRCAQEETRLERGKNE